MSARIIHGCIDWHLPVRVSNYWMRPNELPLWKLWQKPGSSCCAMPRRLPVAWQYIPECLDSNIVPFTSEGRVYDLWDKGITIFQHLDDPEQAKGPSWALLLCTLLLGSEWLIRKLLRLA